MAYRFPLSYRWFLARNLVDLEPWYFTERGGPSLGELQTFARDDNFARQFKLETGATFDVVLFARRQDRDDFAFFAVEGSEVLDRVVTIHLSFSQRMELKTPFMIEEATRSFTDWVRDIVLPDIADWMTEEDLMSEGQLS